jgi:hypothetical protein
MAAIRPQLVALAARRSALSHRAGVGRYDGGFPFATVRDVPADIPLSRSACRPDEPAGARRAVTISMRREQGHARLQSRLATGGNLEGRRTSAG